MGNHPAPEVSSEATRRRAPLAVPWRGWSWREAVLALTLGPLALLGAALVSERLRIEGHVMPGVWLDGTPIEGLSAETLASELLERRRRVEQRSLTVQVGERRFPLSAAELAAGFDDRVLHERLLGAGRSGDPFEQVGWRLARWFAPARFEAQVSLDMASWEQHIRDFEHSALVAAREGAVRFEGRQVVAVEPAPGQAVDRAAALTLLREALDGKAPPLLKLPLRVAAPLTALADVEDAARRAQALLSGPVTLHVAPPSGVDGAPSSANQSAPDYARTAATPADGTTTAFEDTVEVLSPEALGQLLETRVSVGRSPLIDVAVSNAALETWLAPIRARRERPATDAKFLIDRRGKISVEPSRVQIRIRTEDLATELQRALSAKDRTGALHLVLGDTPRITTELAHRLNIRKLVGQFTTHHPCCRPRVKNIQRIADLIDGAIVLPGEAFSVNEHVGPRTPQNGFVSAPTIVLGQIKDTIGGGVSQFATTIFNAVFNAGYEIVERQPHSFYFTRYPAGHEATLSYPKPDFIFRNDTHSGVLLKTEYGPDFIRVKVFGDNEGRRVKRHVSARFDLVDAPLEYEANDEIDVGEEKVLERGEPGWSVLVSRVVTDAAGEAHKESRKVTYNPRTRRVAVHSCQIPKGEPGYTGRECPEPDELDETGDTSEGTLRQEEPHENVDDPDLY